MQAFGIDLGTTYSAIAAVDANGQAFIIPNNPDQQNTLDSAVYFPEGDEVVVGKVAREFEETEGNRVVRFIKREIGDKTDKVFTFNGKTYNAIDISARILTKIGDYAGDQGHKVRYANDEDVPAAERNGVVITCPAYFGFPEREATKQAGEIAGYTVLDIIDEPIAAALAYFSGKFPEDQNLLVYDLGGGTFDVALLEFAVSDGDIPKISVKYHGGNKYLGGKDWDSALAGFVLTQYCKQSGESEDDVDVELKWLISSRVEDLKKKLTEAPKGSVRFSHNSVRYDFSVTRDEFEALTSALLSQTMQKVDIMLNGSGIKPDDIDKILLVGGSTYMPAVHKAIENKFGRGKMIQLEPDLDVAKGAAIYAQGLIKGDIKPSLTENQRKAIEEQVARRLESDPGFGALTEEERTELIGTETEKAAEKEIDKLQNEQTGYLRVVPEIQPVTPRSFGPFIRVPDENNEMRIDNLVFMGDPTPAAKEEIYETIVDNQDKISVQIYENTVRKDPDKAHTYVESTDAAHETRQIGILEAPLPDGLMAGSPVKIKIVAEPSGITVTATITATGEEKKAYIVSDSVYNEEEVRIAAQNMNREKVVSDITDAQNAPGSPENGN